MNANDEDTKNFKMAGFQYAFKVEIGNDSLHFLVLYSLADRYRARCGESGHQEA